MVGAVNTATTKFSKFRGILARKQTNSNTEMRGMNEVSPRPPSPPPLPPPHAFTKRTLKATTSNVTSCLESSESDDLQRLVQSPSFVKTKKIFSKQLSMCETPRDKAWDKRRRQILKQERKKNLTIEVENLTDEDFNELKGSIELGFGFNEEAGQHLCNTFPALDLYFAVNRRLSISPVSTPHSQGSVTSNDSPTSEDAWKICGPGDDPQQVKTKLRHWAQAVACSVKQQSIKFGAQSSTPPIRNWIDNIFEPTTSFTNLNRVDFI